MAKTLKDYFLEGGVKGKRFIDPNLYAPDLTLYEVKDIVALGLGEPKPTVALYCRLIKTNEVYIKSLALCLNHKESEEQSEGH